jgi:O-antigen ligase
MIDFVRKHLILNVFFLFLGVCLFLGDGQQMLIDVVGAGGVLVFILVAFLYGKRQRELPLTPTLLLGGTIFYFCIRTIFSDDIGYSVYTTVRMVEAFIIFYILYCFTTDEDRKVFPTYLLGFCIFSLFASIVYIFTPILSNTLTKSNLLVPTYGHNNVVDILLFGIPIAFFQLISQKKPLYVYIIMFLLFGIIFSFSRTAMMIVVLFLVISLLFYWKKISLKKRLFLGFFFFSILGILSLLLVIPQTTYKKYVPITILPKMTKQVDGAGNRFEYFRQAIEAIKERPLFGSGPGTFLLQSKRLQKTPDSYSRYAHNVLLQELTEVGAIGTSLLLLFLLWCFIHIWKAYNRGEKPKQYLLIMLASGVVLQILNASFDFSLNFFVVQLLVVSTLAVMTSFGNQKDKTVSFLGAFILTPSLILVFLFYLITSICSMGLRKHVPLLSTCCYLSEFISINLLENTGGQISNFDQSSIIQFHKRNSSILELLGIKYLNEAAVLSPKDMSLQNKYFYTLLRENNYSNIGLAIQHISTVLFSDEKNQSSDIESIESKIQKIDFTDQNLRSAFETVGGQIPHETLLTKEFFAKYFYLLGYEMLTKDIHVAIQLWSLATQFAPQWSYFPVELASLYYFEEDYNKAIEVLIECQKSISSKGHCDSVDFSNFESPGFYKNEILQIPKENIMFIDNQLKNHKNNLIFTINILKYLIRSEKIGSALNLLKLMTLRILSEQDRQVLSTISFNDSVISMAFPKTLTNFSDDVLNLDENLFFSKLYYFLGYSIIHDKPGQTKALWNIAFHLSPQWSYFPVELASLYHKEGNDVKAKEILEECQKNIYAASHCKDTDLHNIPKSGFFRDDILIIPKEGFFIKKQYDE